jgi:hypothetical protein
MKLTNSVAAVKTLFREGIRLVAADGQTNTFWWRFESSEEKERGNNNMICLFLFCNK